MPVYYRVDLLPSGVYGIYEVGQIKAFFRLGKRDTVPAYPVYRDFKPERGQSCRKGLFLLYGVNEAHASEVRVIVAEQPERVVDVGGQIQAVFVGFNLRKKTGEVGAQYFAQKGREFIGKAVIFALERVERNVRPVQKRAYGF